MRTLSSVLNDEQVLSSAGFSVDKLHRFWLMRRVGPGARVLVWCMLNPSKAGSQGDDPTIRRVTGFTRAFGYDVAVVVNLFSWRATEPRDCLTHLADASPHDNYRAVGEAALDRDIVCAWGAHEWSREQADAMIGSMHIVGARLFHLGLSKHGMPRHPLMLPKTATMVRWNGGF